MSKIITVTEGNLPSGVKTSQVKTKEQKGDFAKGSNKTITFLQNIKSTEFPIKALVAGDNINLTQSRSLFLKFDPNSFGAFYSDRSMDRIGKIQSITIIPSEPRQVAIQIGGNMFYIFNYDDIFVNTDNIVKASSSSAKASLGDNVPVIHFTELTMPTSTTDLTSLLTNLTVYKDRLHIKEVPKSGGNFINIPNNIDEVSNLYVDSLGASSAIYQFDINKISTVLVIDNNEDNNFPIYVLILIDKTYYKFPYRYIKIQGFGRKSESLFADTSSSSSSAKASSSSSSAKASSSLSAPNSPSSFFNNNGVGQSTSKEYTGRIIQYDFCQQVRDYIQGNNFKKISDFPVKNINDIPEFYVFVDSINSQNHCILYQINLRNIESIQIISGSNRFKGDNVLFTYKDNDFNFFNHNNELYVPTKELYYREPVAPMPRGEKEPPPKGRSVRFDPSPSFESSKPVPPPSGPLPPPKGVISSSSSSSSSSSKPLPSELLPAPPKEVKPLKTEGPENHSSYEEVDFNSIPDLVEFELPFDTTTQNLYLYYNSNLRELPNISSVEEGSNNGFVTVTQTMPKGYPIQLEYQKTILYQAPKNIPNILNNSKEQLKKIYNNLLDASEREVAAGINEPTPSQTLIERFKRIVGKAETPDEIDDAYKRYIANNKPVEGNYSVVILDPVNGIINYEGSTFDKLFDNLYLTEKNSDDDFQTVKLKNINTVNLQPRGDLVQVIMNVIDNPRKTILDMPKKKIIKVFN